MSAVNSMMYSPGSGSLTSIVYAPVPSDTVWPTVRVTVCVLSAIALPISSKP